MNPTEAIGQEFGIETTGDTLVQIFLQQDLAPLGDLRWFVDPFAFLFYKVEK